MSSFKVANANPVQDGSATTLSQFQADPDGLRTVLAPMDIPESSRKLMISVQVRMIGEGWAGGQELSVWAVESKI